MAWYMQWGTIYSFNVLPSKDAVGYWQIGSTTILQGLGLTFFWSPKLDKYDEGYAIPEYFTDLMSSYIRHRELGAMELKRAAHCHTLPELYSFIYDTFNQNDVLQALWECQEIWENPESNLQHRLGGGDQEKFGWGRRSVLKN